MKIKEYYGEEVVIPIYIEVEDGVRLSRALNREMKQSHPKYEEMCRRFLADAKDFSKENLQKAHIDKVFENKNLDDIEDEIAEYIKSQM